jgi:hypothetical protein
MVIAAAASAAAAADPGLAVRPPVTGIAVTSAVNAVTGDVTTVICGRAGRDLHCARRDRRARSPLAESPGPWPGNQPLAALVPLALESLACATEVAFAAVGSTRHA